MVIHDVTVDRTTDGAGAVAELSLAELQALDVGYRFSSDGREFPFRGLGVRILTLEEVLREILVPAMIDLKDSVPDARQAVAEVLARARATTRVCWGSWDDEAALALADLVPDATLFFPADAARAFVHSALAHRTPPDQLFDVLALPTMATAWT